MTEVRAIIPTQMQEMIQEDWHAKQQGVKELDVVCKDVPAKFFVDVGTGRCMIRTDGGRVITPNAFELECGLGISKAWLQSILVRGTHCARLLLHGTLCPV